MKRRVEEKKKTKKTGGDTSAAEKIGEMST